MEIKDLVIIEYIRPDEKLRLPYSSITGLPKRKVEVTA